MLVLTLGAAVAVTFALEWGWTRVLPRLWRAVRWSLLPSLGGLMGALLPLGVAAEPLLDWIASLFVGAMVGVLVALFGSFRPLLARPAPAPTPRPLPPRPGKARQV